MRISIVLSGVGRMSLDWLGEVCVVVAIEAVKSEVAVKKGNSFMVGKLGW